MSVSKQELLKKLKALAERGVGGEKETAQRKLDELIKKYNIDEEELLEDRQIDFEFHYKSKYEKQLLEQICYRMFGKDFLEHLYRYRYGKGVRSIIGVSCTKAEGLQIRIEFDFYKSLYYEELEIFQDAFIQKHEIFPKGSFADKELSEEERKKLKRMFAMMNTMQDKNINPMIEDKHI